MSTPPSPGEVLREILIEQRGWRAEGNDVFVDREGRRRSVFMFNGGVHVEAVRRIAGAIAPDAGPPIIVGESITTVSEMIEFIPLDMLLMNPFKHEMVPIYSRSDVPAADGANTFMRMSPTDPIAVLLGLRAGDMLISRPKATMSKCTPRVTVRVIASS